jgi:zinc transport system substrate-binding protein
MRYIISSVMSICALAMTATAASADVPRVITDIPPVHALTAQVMGDLGTPVLLLARGADEHDFALRPSQMSDIANADMAIWVGPELTPWLARAWEGAKEGAVSLPLLQAEGVFIQDFQKPQTSEEAGHEGHDHGEHDHQAEGHEGHDHGGIDPHAWLDPHNAAVWLDAIAAGLGARDPANAATYAANAARAKEGIAALDAELSAQLAPLKGKAFVTYHDAYGYFTAHYGLTNAGAVALGDAAQAGAAHVQQLQARIADGVVCVFPEAQHDAQLLLQLLDGTSAKAGVALDPVGSTLDAGPDTYANLMRGLANGLSDCLGGA